MYSFNVDSGLPGKKIRLWCTENKFMYHNPIQSYPFHQTICIWEFESDEISVKNVHGYSIKETKCLPCWKVMPILHLHFLKREFYL